MKICIRNLWVYQDLVKESFPKWLISAKKHAYDSISGYRKLVQKMNFFHMEEDWPVKVCLELQWFIDSFSCKK